MATSEFWRDLAVPAFPLERTIKMVPLTYGPTGKEIGNYRGENKRSNSRCDLSGSARHRISSP
jgi:hypothetical protein